MRTTGWIGVGLASIGASVSVVSEAAGQDASAMPEARADAVPGTSVVLTMVRVGGDASAGIKPFWIAARETTWDHYDVFVYRLDLPGADVNAEAESRPSKPYVPPDRGFGHAGYPAMGMTFDAATRYCAWLSEKTGRRYRLPTEAEWELACLAGDLADADGLGIGEADSPARHAWWADNADWTTHPAGTREPSPWGLFDTHGNVAEWVVGRDGAAVAKGGSYLDEPEALRASARQTQQAGWNASDPQIPKSRWWLADCSWVGFRVVCEDEPAGDAAGE